MHTTDVSTHVKVLVKDPPPRPVIKVSVKQEAPQPIVVIEGGWSKLEVLRILAEELDVDPTFRRR